MRTILIAAAILAVAPSAVRAQGTEVQRIDTTFAFEKGGLVDLGHVSGDIVVTGWTKPEAKVFATIETGYLESTLSPSRIRLSAHSRRGRMGRSRYEISVPIGTEVRATTVSGNIAVRSTTGEVSVHSTSGDVEVRDANRVEVGTISGDIRASKLRGRIRATTTSGDIRLDDVEGELTGSSVSGNLELSGSLTGLEFETISGEVTFSGEMTGSGAFRASTHSGDVRFTLPATMGANLELQTFSGDLRTGFPMTLQPGERVGARTRRLQTTINGGGTRIRLETFSGDVIIEKGASRSNKEN